MPAKTRYEPADWSKVADPQDMQGILVLRKGEGVWVRERLLRDHQGKWVGRLVKKHYKD